jgi:protein arginine kinase
MNGYNFTERVRKVLAMAREEAARLHHEYVGTEHILLGLIREGEGVAAQILQVMGLSFDGSRQEIIGNIFQISNQITLGRAEEEIVENLTAVTKQIIDKEKEARKILFDNNRMQIEDKIWRSWGIMNNARVMNSHECMKLLSDVRLGVDEGLIGNLSGQLLNEIMIETQNASIQKHSGRELSAAERDIIRAEMVRGKLNG